MVNTTLQDVALKEDVSYDTLLGILDRWMTTTVDWATIEPFTTLGLDEIALRKGHGNFVAIITAQTTSGRVQLLAVLPDRLKTTVSTWLSSIPEVVRERITTVCTDMWDGYVAAASEAVPAALIVIDRFHVARHYRDAVDSLRKQEVRRLRSTLPADEQSVLDKTLWPLRKAAADLTEDEQFRLDGLLALSAPLAHAYRLREELTTIFTSAHSKAEALERIEEWREQVACSGVTCFASFLKLLDKGQDRITNYFHSHQTSGFVEGFNNKLKVLKRRCYGLTNTTRLFQRLTLDLEGYRRFSRFA